MVALKDLSQEAIWFDKYKYEDAERRYYEKLAKGGSSAGDAPASAPQSQSFLASEIARARQQIKNSLECGDSESVIMPLSTELSSKVTTLEKENTSMKNVINNLELLIKKLDSRVMALEARLRDSDSGSSPAKASDLKTKESQPSRNEEEDDDDDIDLFGSDEDEEANRIREERLQAYAAKKEKKPAVIAKSSVVLDVKPWDDETDMKTAEEKVREISMEGLTWGAAKLIPLAYGIKKLQIMCTVVDDLVSVEELSEKIEAIEDFVQSVDVAAFNKI